eukprot:scaffold117710_cov54-Attheya_sp.AAC.1
MPDLNAYDRINAIVLCYYCYVSAAVSSLSHQSGVSRCLDIGSFDGTNRNTTSPLLRSSSTMYQ